MSLNNKHLFAQARSKCVCAQVCFYLQYTNLRGWQIRVLTLFQVFLRIDLSVEQSDRKAPKKQK